MPSCVTDRFGQNVGMTSKAGYWWGGVLTFVGCAVAAIAIVALVLVALAQSVAQANSGTNVDLPSDETYALAAQEYIICYSPSADGDARAPINVHVYDKTTGAEVRLKRHEHDSCLSDQSRFKFTPPHDGDYRITATGGDGGALILDDKGGVPTYPSPVLGALAVGVIAAAAGIWILVRTSNRRRRVRHAHMVQTPGPPQGYGPSGYQHWGGGPPR